MVLTLVYITGDQIIKQEELVSSLAEAKEIAELRIADGAAERIEILDQAGVRISQRPRMLRNA